jgi:hypothetical protein
MYSTCTSCYTPLGSNSVLTLLPVGRLVVFDAHRGRLWVVCQSCRSWNLVPLEERWEAIEEAAKRFDAARRHARSEHISLAFLEDGFGLIHVGRASVTEFAAWRFGTELFSRWTRFWSAGGPEAAGIGLGAGTSLGVVAGTITLGAAPFVMAAGALLGLPVGVIAWSQFLQRRSERTLLWMFDADGTPRAISVAGGSTAELLPDEEHGWGVSIYDFGGRRTFEGYAAWRVLAAVLSHKNRFGARRDVIESAVGHIEDAGESQVFLDRIARSANGRVSRLPRPSRLALEISLHETAERRALEHDLMDLTNEWREAEEIAQIADGLLIPESVTKRIEMMRDTTGTSSARMTTRRN